MISDVLDNISEYIQIKGEKIKLQVMAKMASFLGAFIAFLMLLIVGVFFVVFLSIALAIYLNGVLESAYYGYLIVAGIYFIKLILLVALVRTRKFQKWLEIIFLKYSENTESDE